MPLIGRLGLLELEVGLLSLTIWWPEPTAIYIFGRVWRLLVEPVWGVLKFIAPVLSEGIDSVGTTVWKFDRLPTDVKI